MSSSTATAGGRHGGTGETAWSALTVTIGWRGAVCASARRSRSPQPHSSPAQARPRISVRVQ
nr:hypothetical protein [Lysobacter enzymogenes]